MDYSNYIRYEQMDAIEFLSEDVLPHIDLYSEEYCMVDFVKEYVDLRATEEANCVYNYIASNEYITDADIDMTKIRIFRTWLAKELLKMDTDMHGDAMGKFSPEQRIMLEYYKNGMYNEVIRQLAIFGTNNAKTAGITSNSCGCCANNTVSLYDLAAIEYCDVSAIYINNIHKLMVETFESPEFWIELNVDFIKIFKKYIDNILIVGLTVNESKVSNPYVDCVCTTKTASNTDNILRNLSTALGYIVDRSHMGHMNFIHDSLYNWAEYLYDKMYWEIKPENKYKKTNNI
jgi:hypothetical protein